MKRCLIIIDNSVSKRRCTLLTFCPVPDWESPNPVLRYDSKFEIKKYNKTLMTVTVDRVEGIMKT